MRFRHLALASALSLAAFASAAPNALAQQAAAMKYCKADFERLCPGVQPGGGRIIGCLKAHKEEVSIGCGNELKGMKPEIGQFGRAGICHRPTRRTGVSRRPLCRSEPLADHLFALRP